jgi:hypothetical protein
MFTERFSLHVVVARVMQLFLHFANIMCFFFFLCLFDVHDAIQVRRCPLIWERYKLIYMVLQHIWLLTRF